MRQTNAAADATLRVPRATKTVEVSPVFGVLVVAAAGLVVEAAVVVVESSSSPPI